MPLRSVGVDKSGVVVAFLVSSVVARAAPALDRVEGPTPPPTLEVDGDKVGLAWCKATGQTT